MTKRTPSVRRPSMTRATPRIEDHGRADCQDDVGDRVQPRRFLDHLDGSVGGVIVGGLEPGAGFLFLCKRLHRSDMAEEVGGPVHEGTALVSRLALRSFDDAMGLRGPVGEKRHHHQCDDGEGHVDDEEDDEHSGQCEDLAKRHVEPRDEHFLDVGHVGGEP